MPDVDNPAIRSDLARNGFTVVRGVELSDVIKLANSVGNVTMDKRSPQPYRRISPQRVAAAKGNTLSSRYGLGSFPFHTDVAHWTKPATHVLLYCEAVGSGHRPTELIDTQSWKLSNGLRHSLTCDLWKAGHLSPKLRTVGTELNGTLAMRYDPGCMRPANSKSERLKDQLDELIAASKRITITWARWSLVIIDNARMLHARGAASAADVDRVLIRILVGGNQ